MKYDENNLFSKKNKQYQCILKENDINNIKVFLKDIVVENREFRELCETNNNMKGIDKDEDGIFVPKPILNFKGKRLN